MQNGVDPAAVAAYAQQLEAHRAYEAACAAYEQQMAHQTAAAESQQQHGGDQRPLSKTTVFVGGLGIDTTITGALPEGQQPSKIDEAALYNFFFANCGEIKSVRVQNNRGFAFIEFGNEMAAAAAMALTGTSVALDPAHPENVVRITVKYAHERAPKPKPVHMERPPLPPGEQREGREGRSGWSDRPGGHREGPREPRVVAPPVIGAAYMPPDRSSSGWGRHRSPSPPPKPRYSESEARNLKETLKNGPEKHLPDVANVIAHWCETGDCTKKTADNFYFFLQTLMGKTKMLKALEEERRRMREAEDVEWAQGIMYTCSALEKAFVAATKQRVRDTFSKAQRKNLETWTATALETVNFFRGMAQQSAPEDADEEKMEVEGGPAPPPPPQEPAPSPPEVSGSKRKREDSAEQEAEELRQTLAARDQLITAMGVRMQALEAELEAKSTAIASAAPPPPAAPQPHGAPMSELTAYLAKLAGPQAALSGLVRERVPTVASQALSSTAGVFMRVDRGIGEPVWHLSAFHTVSELLSKPAPNKLES
ncbi:hypothetical protein WJX72_010004 [[Myrmecia] bisecta]|uniref:RRM domain-containing protein n=1 Tax=[Myrmecia] bisecta TaxID=41462 RepID=A0AAW1QG77_9CHLO